MTQPLLLIAAGGTGGHMFPAQALAEAMLAKGWRVKLSTDARGARYTGAFPDAVQIEEVKSATFARGGALAKLLVPFKIIGGIMSARSAMSKDKPAVVVGFGGYPSIPAISAATWMSLPRMIHEQNGVLGRVNRVFAAKVNKVACGTWPTDLPEGVEGIYTGNPVRSAVLDKAAAPYVAPEGDVSLLVIGGSQGARILSDVVPAAIAALPADLRGRITVSHQARGEDETRVKAFLPRSGYHSRRSALFSDVPERMERAQLVISRSGASSVADVTVIGRPAILVPFAAATGDHQTANARGVVEAGGAVALSEKEFTVDAVATAITDILTQPARAHDMAQAALSIGRPDATERLVALVEELAHS